MKKLVFTIVLAIGLFSTVKAQTTPLKVIATTTILADVAQNVGGDLVTVESLVPADADAHAFEPTPQDVQKVADADVVLAVGVGYEAFLGNLMDNVADVPVVTVSNGISIYPFGENTVSEPLGVLGTDDICDAEHHDDEAADHEEEHGGCDPHVWTDPKNGAIWADNIAATFAENDPDNAAIYTANAEAYKQQLISMDAEMTEILSVVPEERRVLVTNHEFMGYFARAYSFKIVGVVVGGGTTGSETDPQALAALIQTIKDAAVPAIFAEASANPDLINTVAEEAGVQVMTTLSESLTDADGLAPTYLDYLRYNAQTIADALK